MAAIDKLLDHLNATGVVLRERADDADGSRRWRGDCPARGGVDRLGLSGNRRKALDQRSRRCRFGPHKPSKHGSRNATNPGGKGYCLTWAGVMVR